MYININMYIFIYIFINIFFSIKKKNSLLRIKDSSDV